MSKPVDPALSRLVSEYIKAKLSACWANSLEALREYPWPAGPAWYVEGWLVERRSGLLIEHGWVELESRIVDPTLLHAEPGAYYPGLRFTLGELYKTIRERQITDLPIAWSYGWGGQDNPEYMRAYQEALKTFTRGEQ